MGVVVPYDIAADDVTMGNGKSVESDIAGIKQAIRTLHAAVAAAIRNPLRSPTRSDRKLPHKVLAT